MGCWSCDYWADEDILVFVRDVLIAAGHLTGGDWLTCFQVLMTQINGRPLVHRFSHEATRAIIQGMDTNLSRNDLARLAYPPALLMYLAKSHRLFQDVDTFYPGRCYACMLVRM